MEGLLIVRRLCEKDGCNGIMVWEDNQFVCTSCGRVTTKFFPEDNAKV